MDGDLLQKSEDISHTADLCCVVNTSRVEGSKSVLHHGSPIVSGLQGPSAESDHVLSHVLSVKVIDNVRIPSFSELEILAQVNGCPIDTSTCYMLEGNLLSIC